MTFSLPNNAKEITVGVDTTLWAVATNKGIYNINSENSGLILSSVY